MRLLVTSVLFLATSAAFALDYPVSPRGDVVDVYHGERVADPYRWLEAVDAPEVKQWVKAQNAVTQRQLAKLPTRASFRQSLGRLWNYEKFGLPQQVGDALFYRYNDGLKDQAVLIRQSADGQREVVLDPNGMSADGTVALTAWEVSPDGRFLAYGIAEAGSDWNRFFVRDLRSGQDEPHSLDYIKFSGMSWTRDSDGFFYSRYPGKDGVFGDLENQALYYHRRGTPQSLDVQIFARPDQPRWGFSGEVSRSGRYLLISVWQGASDQNALYVRDLKFPHKPHLRGPLIPVVEGFEARYEPIGVEGSTLYLLTTDDAPRGRVIAVDLNRPGKRREVLAETEDAIEFARYGGGHIVLARMHDAVHRLLVHEVQGGWQREVDLAGMGSVAGMTLSPDAQDLLFLHETFVSPRQQMRLHLASGQHSVLNRPQLPFEPADFVTEQVFYSSRDGTRVPMFIVRRKDLAPSRPRPTYLYGYGGFSIALTPSFRPARLAWLEQGGLLAVANLRGGSEYGEAWHQAGTGKHKQNVFDDFIAAAEYLVDQGLSSADQIGIVGRSNGGLLVGAVSNQRPDLFAAAIPGVGVMDMLRFHKFTIGWAWTGDYGSADDPALFPVLRAYSPYHNIPDADDFPAVLVTTADHDDRVVPGHSFKYAAALQHADPGNAPKLIRIQSRAGHGRGMPTSVQIEQAADELAFLAAHTGLKADARIRWRRLVGQP